MSRTAATFAPPVMEARRWLDGVEFPADRPLINVSQAAPVDPPPPALRAEMARVVSDIPDAHLYGPVLGLDVLRAEISQQWSASYGGEIAAEQVAITSGCNQAFAAAIAAICAEGDNVIQPCPYYFNHKMWLDMAGIDMQALHAGAGMLPDPAQAETLIDAKTRAIVLVTPNNPAGVEYPADLMEAFYQLAKSHGIKLIIDETYRDFHSQTGPAHGLFTHSDWADTVIQLYSFSKAYRLTGHRVGAMIADLATMAEAEKFLDTVAICPNQLGQYAALWGMQNLGVWLAGERNEILARRAAIAANMDILTPHGWTLMGLGSYFAYLEHPFDVPSDQLAQQLVTNAGILCLPGTMFMPDGDARGKKQLRIAFANIDAGEIAKLFDRLAGFAP